MSLALAFFIEVCMKQSEGWGDILSQHSCVSILSIVKSQGSSELSRYTTPCEHAPVVRNHLLSGLVQLSHQDIHDLLYLCKNHMSSHELAPSQDGDTSINPRVFHLFEYRLFDRQKEMILISREFFCSFLLLLDALYLLLLVESMILILSAARWLRTLAWTPMLWLVAVNNQYF